eukprot:Polyplicarium_translucidae@DN2767_c0_g1_i1.p1
MQAALLVTRRYAAELARRTALHNFHKEMGATLINFHGWMLPARYPDLSPRASHLHTRAACSLFDVSHMNQLRILGGDRKRFLERLVPSDVQGMSDGLARYTVITNDAGGIEDDAVVSSHADFLHFVGNAACAAKDVALLREARAKGEPLDVVIEETQHRALIALQGPESADVLERCLGVDLATLKFMRSRLLGANQADWVAVTRCGYTGEDGFEVSVPNGAAEALARGLAADSRVRLAGLEARDSLRLEAGLCLYGTDLDSSVGPIEAGLGFVIAKRRRKDADFPGAAAIAAVAAEGPRRRRVGLVVDGPVPRGGCEVEMGGSPAGVVTSGGFSPCLSKPIAMALVEAGAAEPDTVLEVKIRDRPRRALVARLPFVRSAHFKN